MASLVPSPLPPSLPPTPGAQLLHRSSQFRLAVPMVPRLWEPVRICPLQGPHRQPLSASLSLPAPSCLLPSECCTTSAHCSFLASPHMWVLPKGPSLPSAPSCPPPSFGQGHCFTSGLPGCHKHGMASQRPPLLQFSSSLLPSVPDSTSDRGASGRIRANTSTGRTVPSEPQDATFWT